MARLYIQMKPIEGESEDKKHRNWIDAESFSWGVSQPADFGPKSKRGKCSREPNCTPMEFMRTTDKATAELKIHCLQATEIPEATVEIFAAAEDRNPLVRYKLKKVVVTSLNSFVDAGGGLTERLTLAFSETEWTVFDRDGKTTASGWNWPENCRI